MTKYMDYMISSRPIRIFNSIVDSSKLKVKSLTVINGGHLPGRTMQRKDANFMNWAFVVITDGGGYYQVDGGPLQRSRLVTGFACSLAQCLTMVRMTMDTGMNIISLLKEIE